MDGCKYPFGEGSQKLEYFAGGNYTRSDLEFTWTFGVPPKLAAKL